jgi:hypothetical protein
MWCRLSTGLPAVAAADNQVGHPAANVVPFIRRSAPKSAADFSTISPPMLIERSAFPLFRSQSRKIAETPELARLAAIAIALGTSTRFR